MQPQENYMKKAFLVHECEAQRRGKLLSRGIQLLEGAAAGLVAQLNQLGRHTHGSVGPNHCFAPAGRKPPSWARPRRSMLGLRVSGRGELT